MKISPHFSVEEWDRPYRLRKGKIFPLAPYPREWVASRLQPLADQLEILRAELGKPIHVSSGYRDPAYNVAIGGARFSQHMEGRAADIIVAGMGASYVHEAALQLYNDGKLLIAGLGYYPEHDPPFVHIDTRVDPATGKLRKHLVRWTGSRSIS